MSDEEYFRLASEALDLGPDGLLMFADLMEERNDYRAEVVRFHAHCCCRSDNILHHICEHRSVLTRRSVIPTPYTDMDCSDT